MRGQFDSCRNQTHLIICSLSIGNMCIFYSALLFRYKGHSLNTISFHSLNIIVNQNQQREASDVVLKGMILCIGLKVSHLYLLQCLAGLHLTSSSWCVGYDHLAVISLVLEPPVRYNFLSMHLTSPLLFKSAVTSQLPGPLNLI